MAAYDTDGPRGSGVDRRAFLRSSGAYATGVAVAVGLPLAAIRSAEASAAGTPAVAIDHPHSAAPSEPVMAYVHDAGRGEVTVMSGTDQRTYRDPDLVERLLAAADPKRS